MATASATACSTATVGQNVDRSTRSSLKNIKNTLGQEAYSHGDSIVISNGMTTIGAPETKAVKTSASQAAAQFVKKRESLHK